MHPPRVNYQREDRWALQNALTSGIDAQAKEALLRLQRQEADLLQQLALGALESDEGPRHPCGPSPPLASLSRRRG